MPLGDRHRRHAAAERLAADPDRLARHQPDACAPRRTPLAMSRSATGWPGRASASLALHVREVAPQRRDTFLVRWPSSEPGHERMVHAGAGAVGDHERGEPGAGRPRYMPALTGPLSGTSIVSRSSGVAHACHDARRDEEGLLPRHLGLRLRRVAARASSTPMIPEEGRHAELLLDAALVGRDQLHVPAVPLRADGPRVRSKAADGFVFTLKASQRITHWMKLKGVGDEVTAFVERRQAPRRPVRVRLVPVPAHRSPTTSPIPRRVPHDPCRGPGPSLYAMEFFADPSWSAARDRLREARAWRGASPRPMRRSRSPTGSRGTRSATSACARPNTPTKEMQEWAGPTRSRARRRRHRVLLLQARGRGLRAHRWRSVSRRCSGADPGAMAEGVSAGVRGGGRSRSWRR